LIAQRKDIRIGLGGLGADEVRKLGLSLSDAFDPCLNLKATGTLLDGYYRLALRGGAGSIRAETLMLQSYYGRDDPSVGAMVKYDEQVRRETTQLASKLTSIIVAGPHDPVISTEEPGDQPHQALPTEVPQSGEAASWDVFNSRRRSSAMVFQNSPLE
jgi:type IV secretion system protein VirB1